MTARSTLRLGPGGFPLEELAQADLGRSSVPATRSHERTTLMKLDRTLLLVLLAACGSGDAAVATDAHDDPDAPPPLDYTEPTVPISELPPATYKGFTGGLYPGGNEIPAGHLAEGMARAAAIQKLDTNGNPSPTGAYVLLSIGMSNTTQEWCSQGGDLAPCDAWTFMGKASVDATVDTDGLVMVNGAKGGQTCALWGDPDSSNWDRVDGNLQALGLSSQQVQAIWLKCANPGPTIALPDASADAYAMLASMGDITRNAAQRYPNLQMIFISNRIYAGYATTTLNPEPYAYETGFAVKWLIEAQIEGDASTPAGDVSYPTAPWLGWAADLWANGATPRSDGLAWIVDDFQSDGTHPAIGGRDKVSDQLMRFFTGSPLTTSWFLAP